MIDCEKTPGRSYLNQTVPESGRPSCLVISPSLSVLSQLNRISPQLTKSHASEASLISPDSQTFYFSILLSSKGHIFYFYSSTKYTLLCTTFSGITFFISCQTFLEDKEKKNRGKKLMDHGLGLGLCKTIHHCRFLCAG